MSAEFTKIKSKRSKTTGMLGLVTSGILRQRLGQKSILIRLKAEIFRRASHPGLCRIPKLAR